MRPEDREGAVEAVLFVAVQPLTVQQVVEALEGQVDAPEALSLLEAIQVRYESGSLGLRVERVAEGFRLVTRPAHSPFVRAYLKAQNLRRLTPAAVEAMAIVAYKQPVTTAEVSAIRGTESGQVLKGLLEKKLIRIAGRKNVVGRPLLYGTTQEFLVHFGLNTLDDLPSFRELEDVFREKVRQESLFREPPPPPDEGDAPVPEASAEGPAPPDSPDAEAAGAPDGTAAPPQETADQGPPPEAHEGETHDL